MNARRITSLDITFRLDVSRSIELIKRAAARSCSVLMWDTRAKPIAATSSLVMVIGG